MIKNERQYKITRAKADEVRVELAEIERGPIYRRACRRRCGPCNSMRSAGCSAISKASSPSTTRLRDATLIEATGIGEFPLALIRARIAREG